MRRARLRPAALALGCLLIEAACRSQQALDPFDPAELAGVYPINQVDGQALGWYHHLSAVDCQVAFTDGELTLLEQGGFDLDLDYNIRCFGTDPFDGSASLRVYGSSMREAGDLVILRGFGPNLVAPLLGIDTWILEVRRNVPNLTLRFAGFYREFWADPVLTMGPRQ